MYRKSEIRIPLPEPCIDIVSGYDRNVIVTLHIAAPHSNNVLIGRSMNKEHACQSWTVAADLLLLSDSS